MRTLSNSIYEYKTIASAILIFVTIQYNVFYRRNLVTERCKRDSPVQQIDLQEYDEHEDRKICI